MGDGRSVEHQIEELEKAKALLDVDSSYYPQIVEGVLPIAQHSDVRIRQWVVNLLVAAFTTSTISNEVKERLVTLCGSTFESFLEESDSHIVTRTIQCVSCIYPLIFRKMYEIDTIFIQQKVLTLCRCVDHSDKPTWMLYTALKTQILKLWNTDSRTLKLACIKFTQCVVGTQTPGIRDPRVGSPLIISGMCSNYQ